MNRLPPPRAVSACLAALAGLALAVAPTSFAHDNSTHLKIDRVVVHKEKRQMFLMSGTTRVRSFPIYLGRNPVGQKQYEGDLRTPEGRYRIIARNDQSRYFRSLRLSYPNTLDRNRSQEIGKPPGGDIMIHGTPRDASLRSVLMFDGPDWTDGCIAVHNRHMQEVWDLVEVGSAVEIFP